MTTDIPLGVRVAERIAAALDRPVTELPPLYDVVDLEALEQLVERNRGATVVVAFEYEGLTVRVHGDGTVEVPSTD
jgi:hypothetical protein